MSDRQLKCVDRVAEEWKGTEEHLTYMLRARDCTDSDLQKFLDGYGVEWEEMDRDGLEEAAYERFSEYGLSFDYVAPYTFTDQEEGYFRYQMSWGGPSDEIRFYADSDLKCYKAEYWFLDWFDGAHVTVSGTVADDVLEFFRDVGMLQSAYDEAMADYEPPCEADDSEDDEDSDND